jgi:hypothetical protein
VLLVGVDDLEPLDEGIADSRVLNGPAEVVEVGLGVQRLNRAFETLTVVGRPEITQAGRVTRTILKLVGGETHR